MRPKTQILLKIHKLSNDFSTEFCISIFTPPSLSSFKYFINLHLLLLINSKKMHENGSFNPLNHLFLQTKETESLISHDCEYQANLAKAERSLKNKNN